MVEVLYKKDKNYFILGGSMNNKDERRGELVSEQLPNYGRTIDGTADAFTTFDVGYGRMLGDRFGLDGQMSV